jgi:5-carboxymethyl-2-hydroxymuconate isomerase|tara:strand:+ start:12048 stop:12404 length:357 start_codon:yes stop_codon:yes gene_type:complete
MPHIVLEYSSNIIEKDKKFSQTLFPKIHQLLIDDLNANIAACKSRAIKFDDFYLADGSEKSFIFFEIKILPGRTKDKIEVFSKNLLELVKKYFFSSVEKKNLAISVNIVEMENYNKFN